MRRGLAAAAAVTVTGLAAAGLTAAQGPGPTRPPAAAPVPDPAVVRAGRPVAAPVRAGDPPRGRIVLRAADPGRGTPYAALAFTHERTRRGRRVVERCFEVGPERSVRDYPVDDGGSCVDPAFARRSPAEPGYAISWGPRTPLVLRGTAGAAVGRIVVEGPGGTVDVPRGPGGEWFVLYGARVRGTATLTFGLRGGATRVQQVELPPSGVPRGGVEAPDPGGLPAWSAAGYERAAGPRRGQTCVQVVQRADAERGRGGGFTPPLCGDLRRHAVVADAHAFGPSRSAGTFAPGPGAPRRLVLFGAAAPGVREVRAVGPDGVPRPLALAPAGRAFVAVFPGTVRADQVAVEVVGADGATTRLAGSRRANAAPLNARPIRVLAPLRARLDRARRRIVLTARLDRPIHRYEVTLDGREVRMRHRGGGRHVGVFDLTRGRPRAVRPGRRLSATSLLCDPGCRTVAARVRLRGG
jgi:hypothetical protein